MAVLGLIGNRPDFELYVYQNGGTVTVDASSQSWQASMVDDSTPYYQTELYVLYQPGYGAGPYGNYFVEEDGPVFTFDYSIGAPGTYHFRVGIVTYSVDEDTGERTYSVSSRSTPVTIEVF